MNRTFGIFELLVLNVSPIPSLHGAHYLFSGNRPSFCAIRGFPDLRLARDCGGRKPNKICKAQLHLGSIGRANRGFNKMMNQRQHVSRGFGMRIWSWGEKVDGTFLRSTTKDSA